MNLNFCSECVKLGDLATWFGAVSTFAAIIFAYRSGKKQSEMAITQARLKEKTANETDLGAILEIAKQIQQYLDNLKANFASGTGNRVISLAKNLLKSLHQIPLYKQPYSNICHQCIAFIDAADECIRSFELFHSAKSPDADTFNQLKREMFNAHDHCKSALEHLSDHIDSSKKKFNS